MKAELYTNCSLVRIPIKKGVDTYYLPQNVDWANRKVDKLIICAPQNSTIDPVDGVTPVLQDISSVYITLYNENNKEIMHDVAASNIAHKNNNPLYVNAKLNLSLCRINFTQTPEEDTTMLMYAFYSTRTEEYYDLPCKSVSTRFDLQANEQITFQEIINTYVHALPGKIAGVIVWSYSNPVWLTLRDHQLTYQMSSIHSELFRADINYEGTAEQTQAQVFYVNDLDIDFDYSSIREASGNESQVSITFLYN